MQVICKRIRLKPGMTDRVRKWAQHMRRHHEEVLKTLAGEGAWCVTAFLEDTPQGAFLLYVTRVEDAKRAREVFRASQLPVDQAHKEFLAEVVASSEDLELLADFCRAAEAQPARSYGLRKNSRM